MVGTKRYLPNTPYTSVYVLFVVFGRNCVTKLGSPFSLTSMMYISITIKY